MRRNVGRRRRSFAGWTEEVPAGREGTATMAARKPGMEWCDWEEEMECAGKRESDGWEEMSEREREKRETGRVGLNWVGSVGYLRVVICWL